MTVNARLGPLYSSSVMETWNIECQRRRPLNSVAIEASSAPYILSTLSTFPLSVLISFLFFSFLLICISFFRSQDHILHVPTLQIPRRFRLGHPFLSFGSRILRG